MSFFNRLSYGIGRILLKAGGRLSQAGERLVCGPRIHELRRWRSDRGDQVLRLAYELGPTALVWDVGGYEGQWASDMVARFNCRVEVFDPMPAMIAVLKARFANNCRVSVHPFALGGADGHLPLSLAADASSLAHPASEADIVEVRVRDVAAVWREQGVGRVDLLKLNIEGAEYDLLDRLIAEGMIASVVDIQVQFHDFVPDANNRRAMITKSLALTHERVWCYDFVWESWRRRENVRL